MRQTLFSLIRAATCLLLCVSCVKDDPDKCYGTVRVYISLAVNTGTYAETTDGISQINLMVFDDNDRYVGEWIDTDPVLDDGYYMELTLLAGNYRFVVYGNRTAPYLISPAEITEGVTVFDDINLYLNTGAGGSVNDPLHPLYHGYLNEAVILPDVTDQRFDVVIAKTTNRVNVTVEGLTDTSKTYKLSINDTNGRYTLANAFTGNNPVLYAASCTRAPATNNLEGQFRVMKLARNRKVATLTFREEGAAGILYEGNLIDLILEAESVLGTIDFDKTSEFDVILRFDGDALLSVGIAINGWEVTIKQGSSLS